MIIPVIYLDLNQGIGMMPDPAAKQLLLLLGIQRIKPDT
jgi:hypothetical protein